MPVRELREDEGIVQGVRPLGAGEEVVFPETAGVGIEPSPPPGIVGKLIGRMMGTDLPREDPLALTRAGTTFAGAVGGTALGLKAQAVIPPLGPPGLLAKGAVVLGAGAVGAVGGAVAPEATLELMEALGFVEEGTRERVGLSNEELRTVAEGEALLDLAFAGTFQAGAQLARGGARLMAGTTKEGTEIAEQAARQGIDLPVVAAGESKFAKFFTSVFGRFPFVGTKISKAGVAAEKQINIVLRDLPNRIARVFAESDIGLQIYKNARTLVKATGRHFDARYKDLFAQAERTGVRVTPRATLEKADEIVAKIAAETPPVGGAGKTLDKVREFITDNILALRQVSEGGTQTARLTLRQADGLASKIDQEIAALEPGQRKFAMSLLTQLKIAVQKDAITNLSGEGAEQIARAMRVLDTEFSQTMHHLFETSTAKRFASVRRRGIRGVTFDEATRTPVDELARIVINLKSPQAIEELNRIVSKRTFRHIAARAVDDAIEKGFTRTDTGRLFDPAIVIKTLGLDRAASAKTLAFDLMLRKSGGLTLKNFKDVLNAAEAMARIEIPNVSTFVARGAVIGGAGRIITALLPGIAIGAAASPGDRLLGGLTGMLLFLGGGRAVARLLADPRAARPLRFVLLQTASRANRGANAVRAFRAVVRGLNAEGVISDEDIDAVIESGRKAIWRSIGIEAR